MALIDPYNQPADAARQVTEPIERNLENAGGRITEPASRGGQSNSGYKATLPTLQESRDASDPYLITVD